MGKTTPRLGRGLDSLIGPSAFPATSDAPEPAPATGPPSPHLRQVAVDLLEPNPFQPREHLDQTTLQQLAQSIKQDGLLQPIAVRQVGGKYQIIVGERRWRAAVLAGLQTVPAITRQVSDNEMLALALTENIHRDDLNAVERAKAYNALRQILGVSIEQLAQRLGQDRSTVSNYLRLLELDEAIHSMIQQDRLSMGHARALLGAPPEHRLRMARATVEQDLSVRAVERAVKQLADALPAPAAKPKRPQIALLEQRFTEALGVTTDIRERAAGKSGRIVLRYRTLEDFDRICQRLGIDLADM